MINKFIRSLLLTLLFTFSFSLIASAQGKSLLWKIEGKGIQPSYLFGTLHVLPKSEFQLKKKVENAIMESELLVLELDMDEPGLQGRVMQHAMMQDGQTLDALLSPEEYAALDEEFKATMGMSVAMFNTLKPYLIGSFLIVKFVGEEPAGFDMALMEMAKAQGMPIEGFETVAEQMAYFDSIPYEEQIEDIMEMVYQSEKMEELFHGMVKVYLSEDLDELTTLLETYYDDPQELDILIDQRNKRWIPVIEEKARNQVTFFGVGAGHLGGSQGVIALLRQAGYTVTPVL